MKELRKQLGQKQQVVATCMGLCVTQLSQYENGKRKQSPEMLQRFVDALNRLNKTT